MRVYFKFDVTVSAGAGETIFWTSDYILPTGYLKLLSVELSNIAVSVAGTPTYKWQIVDADNFVVGGVDTPETGPVADVLTPFPIFKNSKFKISGASADGVYSVKVYATIP